MSTKSIKTALGVVFFCLNALSPATALAQASEAGGTPCLPHALVNGIWTDDGNKNEVEIKVTLNAKDDPRHGSIVARYTKKDKVCRHPAKNGDPVPFQVDFNGSYDAGKITGLLFYCLQNKRDDAADRSGEAPYTISISNATLDLTENKDGTKLTGTFKGYNGVEPITFTRSSKADPNQDYQLTASEVDQAILKALQSHGITVSEVFLNRPDMTTVLNGTGRGVAIPVVYNSKDTGPAPLIVLVGIEALPPCKTINVTIHLIQQTMQPNGQYSKFPIPNTGGTGQGDFSSDGLNSAINKAFDQANVNQHIPARPPS